MNGTATKVKDLSGFTGVAALYRLEPPLKPDRGRARRYVVVSATRVLGTPETYIFGGNAKGEVVDWCEMSGSQRGTLSHAAALASAGYSIAGEDR